MLFSKTKALAFSMLELIITITIITILIGVSVASFSTLINKNKIIAGSNRIVAGLVLARSEAITRNAEVIFCKSKDHQTCGGDWSDGQIVTTKETKLIRVIYLAIPARLTWSGSLGKNEAIIFTPSGATLGQQGTFEYCPLASHGDGIAIILEQTGRIRTVNISHCS